MKYVRISSCLMFLVSGILVLLALRAFFIKHSDPSGAYADLMLAAALFAINPVFYQARKKAK